MKHKLHIILLCFAGIALSNSLSAVTVASGSCGTNVTWALDDKGNLIISGTGNMVNYYPFDDKGSWNYYESPWYRYKTNITSVVIENGVTSIGEYAFYDCLGLTSLAIGNSVTSIGKYAFSCSGLTSVTIPDNVTYIGAFSFYKCYDLKNVIIGNGVTSLGNSAFRLCTGLISVILPNTVCLINMNAFTGCYSLVSITIPKSVINIGSKAFSNCSGLTSITCEATTPPDALVLNIFDGVDKSIPLYVPQQSINSYKNTSPWSDFYNIRAIETAVEEVTEKGKQASKLIQEGQVFLLLPDGTRYSILGQIVN